MADTFYRSLLNENEKLIVFIGGGGKSTLINRLCSECNSLNKKVVVSSLFPFLTPLESNILLTNSNNIPIMQIETDLATKKIIYIGKNYSRNRIAGFTPKEIKKIIENIDVDHFFLEADFSNGKSLSSYKSPVQFLSLPVNRIINVIGADILSHSVLDSSIDETDSFWQNKNEILPQLVAENISSQSLIRKLNLKMIPQSYFINKVENIMNENLALPLAKELRKTGADRVAVGSVFESTISIIK